MIITNIKYAINQYNMALEYVYLFLKNRNSLIIGNKQTETKNLSMRPDITFTYPTITIIILFVDVPTIQMLVKIING